MVSSRGLLFTMIILVDSKEQAQWRFKSPVEKKNLATGDYTLKGFESVLSIERKSLDDLVQTVIHDWLRFTKQLRRMAAMDSAAIVVESNYDVLMNGNFNSGANPASVRGKLSAIWLDFGVPTMFFSSPILAAEWAENFFEHFAKRQS